MFDGEGRQLREIKIDGGVYLIRVLNLAPGQPSTILAASDGPTKLTLKAVTYEGEEKWAIDLSPLRLVYADSMQAAKSRPWAAVGMREGLVYVVHADRGEVIGRVRLPIERPDVAWMEPKQGGDPLLLIAGAGELNAYRLDREAREGPAEIMIGP